MKSIFQLLLCFLISCTFRPAEDPFAEKVLGEQFDNQGRLVKKVVTGRIPGEDIYLTITKYDTLGRIVAEYGAQPYGEQFKETFLYDTGKRPLEKLVYTFPGLEDDNFKNYRDWDLYELSDTLVDFAGVVDWRVKFIYDDQHNRVINQVYGRDSLNRFTLSEIDTVAYN